MAEDVNHTFARTYGLSRIIAWPKTTIVVSNQLMFFSRLYFDRVFIHERPADFSMQVLHSVDPGGIRYLTAEENIRYKIPMSWDDKTAVRLLYGNPSSARRSISDTRICGPNSLHRGLAVAEYAAGGNCR